MARAQRGSREHRGAAAGGPDAAACARRGATRRRARLPDSTALIHERMRLGIVSALAVNDIADLQRAQALLETTDGNLSVHARKLEEAQYVACTKSFEGRRAEDRVPAHARRAAARSSATSTTWRR